MSHASTIAEAVAYHAQSQQNHEGEMQLLFAIAVILLIAVGVACHKAGLNKGKKEAIQDLEDKIARGKIMKELKDGQAEPSKPEFANPIPQAAQSAPVPPPVMQAPPQPTSTVVGAQLVTPAASSAPEAPPSAPEVPARPAAQHQGDDLDELLWNALEEEHERRHGY